MDQVIYWVFQSPAFHSALYYVYVFGGCEFLRRFGLQHQKVSINGRLIVNEFFSTLQLCLCIFEASLIDKYYGVRAFFACVAIVLWLNIQTKRTAYANPSPLVEDWLLHNLSTKLFVFLLLCQTFAAYLAYSIARGFWRFSISQDHGLRLAQTFCHTDLKVTIAMGLLYELTATFIDRFIWCKAESWFPSWLANIIGCCGVATLTVLGVQYTGMYFNPILASAATFGCTGIDSLEHTAVYWVGPILGWMLGSRIHTATIWSSELKKKTE